MKALIGKLSTVTTASILLSLVFGCWIKVEASSFVIYDTGVDDNNVALPSATLDSHWQVNGGDSYATFPNPAWQPQNPSSNGWISPLSAPSGGLTDLPAATYSYTQAFDLTGFDVSSALISGVFSSDNESEIFLNGISTGIISPLFSPSFRDPIEEFTITSGFQPGINTIEFRVQNFFRNSDGSIADNNPSPSGLYIDFLRAEADPVAQTTPEPGTILALALPGTLVLLRRRKVM